MKTKLYLILCILLAACVPAAGAARTATNAGAQNRTPSSEGTRALAPTETNFAQSSTNPSSSTPTPAVSLPNFDHIILIVLENRNYQDVIGNAQMPFLNSLANQYVLLTNYFAVTHPSLPNYIALASGSTQGITSDCTDCFVNKKNLADLIEASGRTWKSYEEDLPSPCFVGDSDPYAQKHDPFIYFDSIRTNSTRCTKSIVPITQLQTDLTANQFPNFAWIQPNLCNSGHNCASDVVDTWLKNMVPLLQNSPALGQNSLIIIVYDEADDKDHGSCCGMSKNAGGQVAAVLISPKARQAFQDQTAYSHYSMLKTILTAWSLPMLGRTGRVTTAVIAAPWE